MSDDEARLKNEGDDMGEREGGRQAQPASEVEVETQRAPPVDPEATQPARLDGDDDDVRGGSVGSEGKDSNQVSGEKPKSGMWEVIKPGDREDSRDIHARLAEEEPPRQGFGKEEKIEEVTQPAGPVDLPEEN